MKSFVLMCLLLTGKAVLAQSNPLLPLAVGNSWTYVVRYYNPFTAEEDRVRYSAYVDAKDGGSQAPLLTFTVLRKERANGHTYAVISDVPEGWPPVSSLFIAGKSLRWDGDNLMEKTDTGEQVLIRFGSASKATRSADAATLGVEEIVLNDEPIFNSYVGVNIGYGLNLDESSGTRSGGQSVRTFWGSREDGVYAGGMSTEFIKGYGINYFRESYSLEEGSGFTFVLFGTHGVINGRQVTVDQAKAESLETGLMTEDETPVKILSWAQIKHPEEDLR